MPGATCTAMSSCFRMQQAAVYEPTLVENPTGNASWKGGNMNSHATCPGALPTSPEEKVTLITLA